MATSSSSHEANFAAARASAVALLAPGASPGEYQAAVAAYLMHPCEVHLAREAVLRGTATPLQWEVASGCAAVHDLWEEVEMLAAEQ